MLIESSWDAGADRTRQEIVQRLMAPLRQYLFNEGTSQQSSGIEDIEDNGDKEGKGIVFMLALEEAMISQNSGSLSLSTSSKDNSTIHVTSISKEKSSSDSFWDNLLRPNDLHGLEWHKISIHWVWQGVEQDDDDDGDDDDGDDNYQEWSNNNKNNNSSTSEWDEINIGNTQLSTTSSFSSSALPPLGCCMNVLSPKVISVADKGNDSTSPLTPYPTIEMENVQWTLEATSNVFNNGFINYNIRSTLRSFWKIDSCLLLGFLHCENVSLLGDLDLFDSTPAPSAPRRYEQQKRRCFSLLPNSTLTIQSIQQATSSSSTLPVPLPTSSTEHIQVANLVRSLDKCLVPDLHWQSPPKATNAAASEVAVNNNNNNSNDNNTFQSLGRVFRYAYNYLEDKKEQEAKQKSQEDPNVSSSTRTSRIDWKQSLEDSLAITAGCVATGASFISPVGAAVAVAAVGVKDGVLAAAQKGRSVRTMDGVDDSTNRSFGPTSSPNSRNGEWQEETVQSSQGEASSATNNDTRYHFGDVTRGVMATIQERCQQRQQRQQENQQPQNMDNNDGGSSSTLFGEGTTQARYAGVVGSSVGAALGLAVVGGPIGLVAGSVVAGTAAKTAVERRLSAKKNNPPNGKSSDNSSTSQRRQGDRRYSEEFNPDDEIIRQLERRNIEHSPTKSSHPSTASSTNNSTINNNDNSHGGTDNGKKQAYRFGDMTRGIVQRGKQAMRRDTDSPYQFGDFSRGLFSSKK